MRRKISAQVDGGLSGGPRVRRPGSEDPQRREQKFFIVSCYYFSIVEYIISFKALNQPAEIFLRLLLKPLQMITSLLALKMFSFHMTSHQSVSCPA